MTTASVADLLPQAMATRQRGKLEKFVETLERLMAERLREVNGYRSPQLMAAVTEIAGIADSCGRHLSRVNDRPVLVLNLPGHSNYEQRMPASEDGARQIAARHRAAIARMVEGRMGLSEWASLDAHESTGANLVRLVHNLDRANQPPRTLIADRLAVLRLAKAEARLTGEDITKLPFERLVAMAESTLDLMKDPHSRTHLGRHGLTRDCHFVHVTADDGTNREDEIRIRQKLPHAALTARGSQLDRLFGSPELSAAGLRIVGKTHHDFDICDLRTDAWRPDKLVLLRW